MPTARPNQDITDWADTDTGRRWLRREAKLCQSALGTSQRIAMLGQWPIESIPGYSVQRIYDETASLHTDSQDVIILPHVLETDSAATPQLRHCQQALTAGGILMLLGFNPLARGGTQMRPDGVTPVPVWRLLGYLSACGLVMESLRRFGLEDDAGASHRSRWHRIRSALASPWYPGYLLIAKKPGLPINPISSALRSSSSNRGGQLAANQRSKRTGINQ